MPASRRRGFTLIELLITLTIVAILSALAYPSYRTQVLKGKRAEGRTALLELMQQQERLLTQTGSYRSFTLGATDAQLKTFSGSSAASSAYQLRASTCDPSTEGGTAPSLRECIKLEAVPNAADTEAGTLRLISAGLTRECSGTSPSVCWP